MAAAPPPPGRKHVRDADPVHVPDEKIPATAPSDPFAFLSRERFEHLRAPEQHAEFIAAQAAINATPLGHPTRSLLECLIEDDKAWRSLSDEWKKLTENEVTSQYLAGRLDKGSTYGVEDELREYYRLTHRAARAVVALLNKLNPPQAKCIPCSDNGRGAFYVASLENWFGPFRYPRVLVDTGCTSLLLTLSTRKKYTIRPDDTVLQQLPLALPPATHTYTVDVGRDPGGRTYTLMVTAKDASVRFPVRLAANIPRLAGATTCHLPFLRFHVSAYDAAAMLQWPCLPEFVLAPGLDKHFADAAAVLRAAVESETRQRNHVLLGQAVLGRLSGLMFYDGQLLLIPRAAALPLDLILRKERDAARLENAFFQEDVILKDENIGDWGDEDHGGSAETDSDESSCCWPVLEDA